MTLRELIKSWRHHAEEADKARLAYHVFEKPNAEKRMEIMADVYRRCADELDQALGRVS